MNVAIQTIQSKEVSADLYLPESSCSSAAIVLIHGGGWTSMGREAMAGIAEMLSENGHAVLNIDYRLAPGNCYPAGVEDCRKAVRWLRDAGCVQHGLNPNRIVVFGASAGGHYALLTGLTMARGTVAAIISLSGIADTLIDHSAFPERYELLLGHRPEQSDLRQLNPISYYYDGAPPILCTHCCHDTVVPCECTRSFAAAVRERRGVIREVIYDFDRREEGHAIWRAGTSPRRLYPDLEEAVLAFLRDIFPKA